MAEAEKRNHYQIKGNYKLPKETYRMTKYAIRRTYLELLPNSEIDRTKIVGSFMKNDTENIAINRVTDKMFIDACENAWTNIPEVYRDDVYRHIIYDTKYVYINFVSESTIKRYVAQYIFFVAFNLGFI